MPKLLLLKLVLILSFFNFNLNQSQAQFHLGFELGANSSANLPLHTSTTIGAYNMGFRAGLFVDKDFNDSWAFRTGLVYSLRAFDFRNKDKFLIYHGVFHSVISPMMVVYKIKAFQFAFGNEFILIAGSNLRQFKQPAFHIGLRGELAIQFSKKVRVQFFVVYDLMKTPQELQNNHLAEAKFNTMSMGISLAYRFKNFKKRYVIYSPGL